LFLGGKLDGIEFHGDGAAVGEGKRWIAIRHSQATSFPFSPSIRV
jgi:hypothetical protein